MGRGLYWLYGCEDVVEPAAFRTYCKTFMFAAMCVCLGRSSIRIRSSLGACARLLCMYFRHGGPRCLYMRLGVLCSSWVWGSVWTKSEVVYIAETVRSQRAVLRLYARVPANAVGLPRSVCVIGVAYAPVIIISPISRACESIER